MLQSVKYKLLLLKKMRVKEEGPELISKAIDRIQLAWEQLIETAWAERDISGLRRIVAFGMRHAVLRASTWPYVFKCMPPAGLITRLSAKKECIE
jgi:hypothetical protein